MILSQTQYNWSMKRLAELLATDTKTGSPEDLEIMDLARKVEDYEMSRDTDFESTLIVDEPFTEIIFPVTA